MLICCTINLGIAFTAKIPQQSPNALFDSPIPLALESMRGRPLSLVGVIPLQNVKLDWDNEIHVCVGQPKGGAVKSCANEQH